MTRSGHPLTVLAVWCPSRLRLHSLFLAVRCAAQEMRPGWAGQPPLTPCWMGHPKRQQCWPMQQIMPRTLWMLWHWRAQLQVEPMQEHTLLLWLFNDLQPVLPFSGARASE